MKDQSLQHVGAAGALSLADWLFQGGPLSSIRCEQRPLHCIHWRPRVVILALSTFESSTTDSASHRDGSVLCLCFQ